jgi:hypothetical protein
MVYSDILTLFESLLAHKLLPGESLAPSCSATGTHVGYWTADTKGPSTRWEISLVDLRASCRGFEGAEDIYLRVRPPLDRIALLEDIREGRVGHLLREVSEDPPSLLEAATPPLLQSLVEVLSQDDLETQNFLDMFQ